MRFLFLFKSQCLSNKLLMPFSTNKTYAEFVYLEILN